MPETEKKRSVWKVCYNLIRKDWVRKLIALVLTAIIYVAVLDRLSITHDIPGIDVPINPPSGFVVMQKETPTVRLVVTGSQSLLKRLKPEDFKITDVKINPEKYVEGKPYILQLSPANIHAPLGVTVVSVSPESLRIDIDKLETVDLPVTPTIDKSQSLPSGYKVAGHTIFPPTVRVTAPSMFLKGTNAIKEVKTKPIGLDNMTGTFDINKNIEIPRPDIKISPVEVMVRTNIVREFEEKTYKNLKIRVMQDSGSNIELADIKHATVKLSASIEVAKKLSHDDILVYVSASDLATNRTGKLKLRCTVNNKDVTVISVIPESVKVIIK